MGGKKKRIKDHWKSDKLLVYDAIVMTFLLLVGYKRSSSSLKEKSKTNLWLCTLAHLMKTSSGKP
jgi:hypothetical protein